MQLTIMEFFQRMSSPFLDVLVELMTMLGEETIFILAVAFFLWCASKKKGFAIFSTLFASLIGMSVLKALVKAPRPFQVVAQIEGKRIETATGYSFPSGHTTGAASFYSSLAVTYRKRWLSVVCAVLILMVALSRMYLGVHWPLDVFAGLALGITVTFVAYTWFSNLYDKPEALYTFSLVVGAVSKDGDQDPPFCPWGNRIACDTSAENNPGRPHGSRRVPLRHDRLVGNRVVPLSGYQDPHR